MQDRLFCGARDEELTPGEHLRAELKRRGLDQVSVASAIGVSRQAVNNVVTGRQPISRAMAARLGRLLGHSSDYWLRHCFPKNRKARKRDAGVSAGIACAGGVLVDHQIIRAVKDGIIGIDPFDAANVRAASIHLTLRSVTSKRQREPALGKSVSLKPGRGVIMQTKERLSFPTDYLGRIGIVEHLVMHGILFALPCQVQPGFSGPLRIFLFNAGAADFLVRPRIPAVSLEIIALPVAPLPAEQA